MKKYIILALSLFLLLPVSVFANTNLDTYFDISFTDDAYNAGLQVSSSLNNRVYSSYSALSGYISTLESDYYFYTIIYGRNAVSSVSSDVCKSSLCYYVALTSKANYDYYVRFYSSSGQYSTLFRGFDYIYLINTTSRLGSFENCYINNVCSNHENLNSLSFRSPESNFSFSNDLSYSYVLSSYVYDSQLNSKFEFPKDSSSNYIKSVRFDDNVINENGYFPTFLKRTNEGSPGDILEIERPGIPRFSKIYVPSYESGQCAYMYSSDILRVYETVPTNNSTVDYVEYMVDNHYLYRTGSTTFSQYSTLPNCLSSDNITTSYGYRTDIADILICFVIIVGFVFIVIRILYRTLFKGGRIL